MTLELKSTKQYGAVNFSIFYQLIFENVFLGTLLRYVTKRIQSSCSHSRFLKIMTMAQQSTGGEWAWSCTRWCVAVCRSTTRTMKFSLNLSWQLVFSHHCFHLSPGIKINLWFTIEVYNMDPYLYRKILLLFSLIWWLRQSGQLLVPALAKHNKTNQCWWQPCDGLASHPGRGRIRVGEGMQSGRSQVQILAGPPSKVSC